MMCAFIADEVICGFGRTGNWFGTETFGIKPTSVSMAKAITSAYYPLGAISIEEDLYQAMLEQSKKIGTFGHGYTYTAHPVASAVALKTIEIYERDGIIEHAAKKISPIFLSSASTNCSKIILSWARCAAVGLIGACELVADKATKRAFNPAHLVGVQGVKFCQERGLVNRMLAMLWPCARR